MIVTADDFGLHEAVNQAVEQAAREGILTATSLMVGQPGSADAVERARRLPGLAVGLHLALTDATAMLSRDEIPDLVDATGRFRPRMAREGARLFALPRVRRQLAAEVRAQFRAFAETGLVLDHLDAHKHFHLHPTILGMVLSIGREFGLRAVRLPREPLLPALRMPGGGRMRRLAGSLFLLPWVRLMRARLRAAGMRHNDALFGLGVTGRMDEAALLSILRRLPAGVSELYLHPATRERFSPAMPDYAHRAELAALTSPRVREYLERAGIVRMAYGQLVSG
ncbi:MAG TPA: hopanoid biosynthesis-associated protein HpnK [Gammaproteobacteria bacterium]|nr:hopanoid biosynthesis-associated protein HpnK [Gammaproteobacteria bacterium]